MYSLDWQTAEKYLCLFQQNLLAAMLAIKAWE